MLGKYSKFFLGILVSTMFATSLENKASAEVAVWGNLGSAGAAPAPLAFRFPPEKSNMLTGQVTEVSAMGFGTYVCNGDEYSSFSGASYSGGVGAKSGGTSPLDSMGTVEGNTYPNTNSESQSGAVPAAVFKLQSGGLTTSIFVTAETPATASHMIAVLVAAMSNGVNITAKGSYTRGCNLLRANEIKITK